MLQQTVFVRSFGQDSKKAFSDNQLKIWLALTSKGHGWEKMRIKHTDRQIHIQTDTHTNKNKQTKSDRHAYR